jgi:hypothetical protein
MAVDNICWYDGGALKLQGGLMGIVARQRPTMCSVLQSMHANHVKPEPDFFDFFCGLPALILRGNTDQAAVSQG